MDTSDYIPSETDQQEQMIENSNITPGDTSQKENSINTNNIDENMGENVDENVDEHVNIDDVNIEGSVQSAVQIAPTEGTLDEYDPMLFIQLGDRVVIDSKKYGRTIGTVYYRSLDLISVKPDGVSNTLHYFEVEQTDDEEVYSEDDGVIAAYVIEKRRFDGFVEQQDFRINQIIDTFNASGEMYKSFTIVKVDEENDVIQIQDIDDKDNIYELRFDFTGIEPDEDFKVISIRQLVGTQIGISNEAQIIPVEGSEGSEGSEDNENEEDEEDEEDEIEVVGFIEVVKPKVFREATAYEQRIPDNLQKVDALNDFIGGLDPILQKDPRTIRAVRVLVETLFNLKQATIVYNDDGTIKGAKDVSVSTLAELIRKVPIPLGRPVLNVSKKMYSVTEEEELGEVKENDTVFFENFAAELEQMIENKSSLVSSAMAGVPGGQIVKEWSDQQTFMKKYLSTWNTNSTNEPYWNALSDSDFFRNEAPEFTEDGDKSIFVDTVPGYIPSYALTEPPIFTNIPYGMERALTSTYRKGVERRKQLLLSEEGATLKSYLIFPSKTANNIGNTRSTSLAVDSGRSQMPKETMRTILEKLGTPKDIGTSNDLLLLDVNGSTLGNIPLSDYIEGISVPALGLGDTFATLEQYGLENLELTPSIIDTLVIKIQAYQNQLLATITKLRQLIESESTPEPEINNLIDTSNIFEDILSQPTLVEDLQEYERANPLLAQSDIGKISHLMKKHPDYFQATIGKNSVLIAKALLDSTNASYLQSLKIANMLKYNQDNAGEKPKKNTCKHVADLVGVRRIFDDSERFQKLTEFFKKYQGVRDGNWIDCNICKEHLLCVHERLQIQAYLNPSEKASIEKEIVLKFSGGSFQGKYICRNCGQAIRDLDFDNSIEFDDNGKPKSGRSVLVDDDAIFEEKLDLLVSVPIEPSQKKELNLTDDETKVYNIIREIVMRIGINMENDGYKNIIDRVISWINRFPARNDYNEKKKKRPTMPDYDVAVSRNIITASALFILLEIQTKIPAYTVKHALIGCKSPGFDGYPLDIDTTNKQGLEYVACAVASIRRNEAPWNQTGFQKVTDDNKRQQGIMIYMENVLKEVIGDDMIQAQLGEKRKYQLKMREKGAETGQRVDEIPATFLPEQLVLTPEDAAKDVITPEVVANMGNRGKLSLVKLWIRQAHLLAKKTASLVRGSPHIETTCCLANIESPGTFWKSATDLPPLSKRVLVPNQQGQMLVTEFVPREASSDVVEPDSELYYRIFLKCCFQGPRIGYPHQPGLTNMCPWCGFQFPTSPTIMDTDTEGKSALASQKVNTSTSDFIKLLDTIHTVNHVEPIDKNEQDTVKDIMSKFGALMPSPIPGWNDIIQETTDGFLKLPPDADRGDIAIAAGPISEATSGSESIIQERLLDQSYRNVLEDIVKLSWMNFFQVIQTYFIAPFERLLTQFSDKSLFIPIELKKDLSKLHVKNDLIPILENDIQLITVKKGDIMKGTYNLARSKMQYFVEQMSELLNFKNKIRPLVVPGRELTLVYIQRAMLYGPLATLINPSEIPPGTEIKSPVKSIGDPSMRFLLELVVLSLNKYKSEKLSFNDQEIKELIAVRNEKERVNVIAEFNKLTDEERAIELMNKRLGLGKWAVGGTKMIYAYDKDYYDLERQKREAAGIIDFPGLGPDQMNPLDGRQTDEFGFPVFGDEDFEAEGGYDHNQHGDDDYE